MYHVPQCMRTSVAFAGDVNALETGREAFGKVMGDQSKAEWS